MDFVRSTSIEWTPDLKLLSTDLEKNGGQKFSTGQRFIFTKVTFYKIHILEMNFEWMFDVTFLN